jgi:hypothetical protein
MAADTPSSLEDASAIFVQTVQEVLLRFFLWYISLQTILVCTWYVELVKLVLSHLTDNEKNGQLKLFMLFLVLCNIII